MVEACARGELDLLYCLGGNFLRTLPEPDYVARAMANVPMRVHQDIILTDQMFIEAEGRSDFAAGQDALRTGRRRHRNDHRAAVVFSPEIPRQVGEAQSRMENSARTRRRRLSGARALAQVRNRLGNARGNRRASFRFTMASRT